MNNVRHQQGKHNTGHNAQLALRWLVSLLFHNVLIGLLATTAAAATKAAQAKHTEATEYTNNQG